MDATCNPRFFYVYTTLDVKSPENIEKYKNLQKLKESEILEQNCQKSIVCEFQETEGITCVLLETVAKEFSLDHEFRCRWITLKVHSSLEAVGLTAEFAKVLTETEISCNVIAGFYHDHIFVGVDQAERAVQVLKSLSK